MSDVPSVRFCEDPLNEKPEEGLFVIAPGDGGWGWQLRFYQRSSPKTPLKQWLGFNPHEIEAWEIVENLRKMQVKTIVMTEKAYRDTFKPIFDAPTVAHTLVAPMNHASRVFKPDGSLNR